MRIQSKSTIQGISARACDSFIAQPEDRILITGAAGFIGSRVVEALVKRGFRNLVCFVRSSSKLARIEAEGLPRPAGVRVDIIEGSLLSRQDCEKACKDVAVIFHLAAATSAKSFPDAFLNSVVTTRNLLDASMQSACLRRVLLVSSLCVYSNRQKARLLNESCPIDQHPELRGEAYCFAKVRQEQLLADYGRKAGLPYVIVRPGSVYGAGQHGITARVGINTFGPFFHLGGSNPIPFTYVDNCADAIAMAGLIKGIDSEAFNIVDDDLPTSRRFLRLYKQQVRSFNSIYIPPFLTHLLCYLWEQYSRWSQSQLPPCFNRGQWYANWKRTRYSNEKVKTTLGWAPGVPTEEGLLRYFQSCGEEFHA